MKKFVLIAILLVQVFVLASCKTSCESLVRNNMAEITEEYFFGENHDFSLSICVGRREEPYMIDGIAQRNVDFSLLTFNDKTKSIKSQQIGVTLVIDDRPIDVALQYNPIADRYVFDLGYKLNKNSIISLKMGEKTQKIAKKSDFFKISAQKALKIACQQFDEILNNHIQNGRLLGECYLKIMGHEGDDDVFWAFTFVSRKGESFNVIISTVDGTIFASD